MQEAPKTRRQRRESENVLLGCVPVVVDQVKTREWVPGRDPASWVRERIVANEERDVTLHFAQYAATKSDWLQNYMEFIQFLKAGTNGWLNITFTELNLTLRVFYVESSAYRPLTYLWKEGAPEGQPHGIDVGTSAEE